MITLSPTAQEAFLAEAWREAQRRQVLHRQRPVGLLEFTKATMPEFEENWHHRLVTEHLEAFVAGDIKRLIILQPPRTSKSELVSRRLPAYILGRNPDAQIIATSYGADLARRMNRDVQRIVDGDAYRVLFPATRLYGSNVRTVAQGTWLRNSEIFEVVGHKGYYRGAGVGGAITGMGMNYGIIDDPYKNRQDANSPLIRERVWEWYNSTFRTRLAPGGGILLTMTNWHEDGLAGRLLALAESDLTADQWQVLTLPAIAEEPIADYDPRQAGEALWPTRFDKDTLEATRVSIGSYEWNALYQQRPRPLEGHWFKRAWFDIVQAVPAGASYVRYWDKAGTAEAGAYTAGVLVARGTDGRFYIADVVRGQWEYYDRERVIRQTAELDQQRFNRVVTWIEQEPGSGGKESAQATIRNLAGFDVRAESISGRGSKDSRLQPVQAQAEVGNLRLVVGDWNHAFIEELTAVPFGKYRDQADGLSGAFQQLTRTGPAISFI